VKPRLLTRYRATTRSPWFKNTTVTNNTAVEKWHVWRLLWKTIGSRANLPLLGARFHLKLLLPTQQPGRCKKKQMCLACALWIFESGADQHVCVCPVCWPVDNRAAGLETHAQLQFLTAPSRIQQKCLMHFFVWRQLAKKTVFLRRSPPFLSVPWPLPAPHPFLTEQDLAPAPPSVVNLTEPQSQHYFWRKMFP